VQTLLDPSDREALHSHVRFVMLRHRTVGDHLDLPSGTRVRLPGFGGVGTYRQKCDEEAAAGYPAFRIS
jgi:hypothetical protein